MYDAVVVLPDVSLESKVRLFARDHNYSHSFSSSFGFRLGKDTKLMLVTRCVAIFSCSYSCYNYYYYY